MARVDQAVDKTHFYLYDSNGNVGQLVDAGDGALAASYEYDPYGNLIASIGLYAEANPFKFSTKYLDSETDLYYYGYRYYIPEFGRWVNRDPIEENGGLNFYGFVHNSSVNLVDPLALQRNLVVSAHLGKSFLSVGEVGTVVAALDPHDNQ